MKLVIKNPIKYIFTESFMWSNGIDEYSSKNDWVKDW